MMENTKDPLDTMKFILLANGLPIAENYGSLQPDAYQVIPLTVLGNGRYKSSAAWIDLSFIHTQRINRDLAVTTVAARVEGMSVGDPKPLIVHIGEWPQAPIGLLHWTKTISIVEPNGATVYERFALLVERA